MEILPMSWAQAKERMIARAKMIHISARFWAKEFDSGDALTAFMGVFIGVVALAFALDLIHLFAAEWKKSPAQTLGKIAIAGVLCWVLAQVFGSFKQRWEEVKTSARRMEMKQKIEAERARSLILEEAAALGAVAKAATAAQRKLAALNGDATAEQEGIPKKRGARRI